MRAFEGGDRCPDCGKVRYMTRAIARKVAKNLNRRRPGHLNAYRCGDFFHIGHLPSAVIAGDQTRDELDTVPKRHMSEKPARPGNQATQPTHRTEH